jgi:hypothetical protein
MDKYNSRRTEKCALAAGSSPYASANHAIQASTCEHAARKM